MKKPKKDIPDVKTIQTNEVALVLSHCFPLLYRIPYQIPDTGYQKLDS
jgi:hypothetical protein